MCEFFRAPRKRRQYNSLISTRDPADLFRPTRARQMKFDSGDFRRISYTAGRVDELHGVSTDPITPGKPAN